jgi:alkylation response protein AidB-like acyl-CoA dehydrogenase
MDTNTLFLQSIEAGQFALFMWRKVEWAEDAWLREEIPWEEVVAVALASAEAARAEVRATEAWLAQADHGCTEREVECMTSKSLRKEWQARRRWLDLKLSR